MYPEKKKQKLSFTSYTNNEKKALFQNGYIQILY